jgi:hypothetical protein
MSWSGGETWCVAEGPACSMVEKGDRCRGGEEGVVFFWTGRDSDAGNDQSKKEHVDMAGTQLPQW